jgi:hypothetical protein
VKPGHVPSGPTQQNIVGGQEDLRASLLRARQVQRVKSAKPLFFHLSGAIGNFLVRNNYFVGE